jgi:hypothetical protein
MQQLPHQLPSEAQVTLHQGTHAGSQLQRTHPRRLQQHAQQQPRRRGVLLPL